jgi:DNA-binding transcriptional ArsR family regulator
MKCLSYYTFFETISNKTRMSIIESLLRSPKCVNEICHDIREEQSKVSHSLQRLMECNFLNAKRDGKKKIYSLNEETVIPILRLVDKHVSKFCNKECTRKSE